MISLQLCVAETFLSSVLFRVGDCDIRLGVLYISVAFTLRYDNVYYQLHLLATSPIQ